MGSLRAVQLFCLLLAGELAQTASSFSPLRPPSTSGRATAVQTADSSTALCGVRTAVRRVRDSVLSRERTDEDLKDGIAFFYDRSSKLWEDVWGEHMHPLQSLVVDVYFIGQQIHSEDGRQRMS